MRDRTVYSGGKYGISENRRARQQNQFPSERVYYIAITATVAHVVRIPIAIK